MTICKKDDRPPHKKSLKTLKLLSNLLYHKRKPLVVIA